MNITRKMLLSTTAILAGMASIGANAQEINVWTLSFDSKAVTGSEATIAEEFEAAHPGVDIDITRRGTDEHKTSLRVAAGSDTGPDIYFSWAGLGLGGDYVNAGMSLPLDKYYEQYDWASELVPAAAAFADIYPPGKHGVPYTFKGEVIYYNKDLFAEAGISEEPKTYEELMAAVKALDEKGIPAITFGGSVNWHIMRLMDVLLETTCGAETHDALIGMEVDWGETACAVEAFQEMKTWSEDYALRPFMGIDNNQAVDLFKAGRAAMMLEGNWLVNQLDEGGVLDKIGIFPFPTGTDRLYGFAEYFYISSKSKNPDLAAEYLDHFISTDVQQRFLGKLATNSINSEVVYEGLRPLDNEWNEIFATYSQMFINGDQGFPAVIIPEYWRVINEVASSNMEPQQAADTLQVFIENNS